MYLFDGYCYETLQEAVDAELSAPVRATETGAAVPVSYDSGNLTFATSNGGTFTVARPYPVCSAVGYQHNFTGISLADANETSWLVVAVWCVVWAVKNVKRGI
ncbi:hypothetical protein V2P20_07605 [Methylobacter sp. Wu1]|uniref:hypothetical protein n=1 Tax=Methylobacter sp. Wu1 TaxID=3119359 RepID=UPI002F95D7C9